MEIQYSDLVCGPSGKGVPFVAGGRDPLVGLDCRGVSFIAMRRAGRSVPECPILGASEVAGSPAQEYMEDYFSRSIESWVEVDRATQLGDLVVSSYKGSPHVSVLVCDNPKKVITSHRGRGVLVMPLEAVASVERTLRWEPD